MFSFVCDDLEAMDEIEIPPIIPLLTLFTHREGSLAKALATTAGYLEISVEELKSWEGVPESYRERVAALCRVSGVHWERHEHELFRQALATFRLTKKIDLAPWQARIRDQRLPKDRAYLAASLLAALVLIAQGQPVQGQKWAVPPDCWGYLPKG